MEKPFQSLLTFSHSAGENNIIQSVLVSFFSVFIFSMPSKVILIVIEFMFLGLNMFWALLRLILKNDSESGPKHIYAREHKLYCYIIIHQIFSLARDWSKRVTWANIPPLKLGNIRGYSPIFKTDG